MSIDKFSTVTVPAPDGLRLEVDVGGPEHAPAVILLHGGGQTRHSWSGAARALAAAGYRVLNYDARGHGGSEWSGGGAYSLDDGAGDLAAVAKLTHGSFALVGASLGGATSVHAVARGLRPAAVILVDIVPEPEDAGIDRIVGFMRRHTGGFASVEEAADAVAAYNPNRPRPQDSSGLRRNLRDGADGRLHWHWDPRIVQADPHVHHAKVRASVVVLAERSTPVLLVRGLNSDVVSDRGVALFTEAVPRLQVLDVAGAGHMVVGDRNDRFNAGVFDFLAQHMPLAVADATGP